MRRICLGWRTIFVGDDAWDVTEVGALGHRDGLAAQQVVRIQAQRPVVAQVPAHRREVALLVQDPLSFLGPLVVTVVVTVVFIPLIIVLVIIGVILEGDKAVAVLLKNLR